MKAWFAALSPREQRTVAAGGAVVAAVLVYLLVIEPVAEAFAARQRRIAYLEEQIEWMRAAAAEVARLRAAGADGQSEAGERPPYLAVDAALRAAGLPQPQRLEPLDGHRARLEFERVAFDPLMRVIGRLRAESGLRVTRARIRRRDAPGQVSAGLTFKRPAQ